MAELHLIGTITSARNFQRSRLFCKWSFSTGSGWKIINGNDEGQTQECCDPYSNEPIWDHPVDIHFATQTLQGSPKVLLQVFCRDEFNRILFVSYGTCSIPLKPGFHSVECHTWKPIGNWHDRLKDKFLGTTLQLKSPDVLVNADDRFELLTESMGTIQIDLYVLVRNFDKFGCHL
ncbi:B9 domain-containing protein 2-like [Phymastichus coffea]|uniref:B9 domain-containing protein 2-like n=1 Tax=Phymastichus coffea TaxID=108790 RepID=UPI00273B941C|nr:B9 domain-containing protein 2-like [Phymastichus coffea]